MSSSLAYFDYAELNREAVGLIQNVSEMSKILSGSNCDVSSEIEVKFLPGYQNMLREKSKNGRQSSSLPKPGAQNYRKLSERHFREMKESNYTVMQKEIRDIRQFLSRYTFGDELERKIAEVCFKNSSRASYREIRKETGVKREIKFRCKDIYSKCHPLKISFSVELDISCLKVRNESMDSRSNYIRNIKRKSLKEKSKNIWEISEVKTGEGKTTYELELELCNKTFLEKTDAQVAEVVQNDLYKFMKDIYMYPERELYTAMDVSALNQMLHCALKPNKKPEFRNGVFVFPETRDFSQARNLTFSDLRFGGIVRAKSKETLFFVSVKADGDRAWLIRNATGLWLLTKLEVVLLAKNKGELRDQRYILEGELITRDQRVEIYAGKPYEPPSNLGATKTSEFMFVPHDILYVAEDKEDPKYWVNQTYEERLNYIQGDTFYEGTGLKSMLLSESDKAREESGERLSIFPKGVYALDNDKSFYENLKKIEPLLSDHKFYKTDGFVFTPNTVYNPWYERRKPGLRHRKIGKYLDILKWKPPGNLTIDFKIKMDDNRIMRLYSSQYSRIDGKTEDVVFKGIPGYPLVKFVPDSNFQLNQIVEVKINKGSTSSNIQFVKVRDDKDNPNGLEIVEQIYEQAYNPITINVLRGLHFHPDFLRKNFRFHQTSLYSSLTRKSSSSTDPATHLFIFGLGYGSVVNHWISFPWVYVLERDPGRIEHLRRSMGRKSFRRLENEKIETWKHTRGNRVVILQSLQKSARKYVKSSPNVAGVSFRSLSRADYNWLDAINYMKMFSITKLYLADFDNTKIFENPSKYASQGFIVEIHEDILYSNFERSRFPNPYVKISKEQAASIFGRDTKEWHCPERILGSEESKLYKDVFGWFFGHEIKIKVKGDQTYDAIYRSFAKAIKMPKDSDVRIQFMQPYTNEQVDQSMEETVERVSRKRKTRSGASGNVGASGDVEGLMEIEKRGAEREKVVPENFYPIPEGIILNEKKDLEFYRLETEGGENNVCLVASFMQAVGHKIYKCPDAVTIKSDLAGALERNSEVYSMAGDGMIERLYLEQLKSLQRTFDDGISLSESYFEKSYTFDASRSGLIYRLLQIPGLPLPFEIYYVLSHIFQVNVFVFDPTVPMRHTLSKMVSFSGDGKILYLETLETDLAKPYILIYKSYDKGSVDHFETIGMIARNRGNESYVKTLFFPGEVPELDLLLNSKIEKDAGVTDQYHSVVKGKKFVGKKYAKKSESREITLTDAWKKIVREETYEKIGKTLHHIASKKSGFEIFLYYLLGYNQGGSKIELMPRKIRNYIFEYLNQLFGRSDRVSFVRRNTGDDEGKAIDFIQNYEKYYEERYGKKDLPVLLKEKDTDRIVLGSYMGEDLENVRESSVVEMMFSSFKKEKEDRVGTLEGITETGRKRPRKIEKEGESRASPESIIGRSRDMTENDIEMEECDRILPEIDLAKIPSISYGGKTEDYDLSNTCALDTGFMMIYLLDMLGKIKDLDEYWKGVCSRIDEGEMSEFKLNYFAENCRQEEEYETAFQHASRGRGHVTMYSSISSMIFTRDVGQSIFQGEYEQKGKCSNKKCPRLTGRMKRDSFSQYSWDMEKDNLDEFINRVEGEMESECVENNGVAACGGKVTWKASKWDTAPPVFVAATKEGCDYKKARSLPLRITILDKEYNYVGLVLHSGSHFTGAVKLYRKDIEKLSARGEENFEKDYIYYDGLSEEEPRLSRKTLRECYRPGYNCSHILYALL